MALENATLKVESGNNFYNSFYRIPSTGTLLAKINSGVPFSIYPIPSSVGSKYFSSTTYL